MKTFEEIKKTLRSNKSFLSSHYHINTIGIFGSYSRGEENPQSDIDILISLSKPIGWEFVDLKEYLEELLQAGVDLVTTEALKPQVRDSILKEVTYI